ncbi:aldolase/citrate lyase family protein [Nocardioides sp. B-3]|nr:aldolase/citrate lyase family protein [Nocardioides sp. B-3]UUZ59857.1 aldolase/citrate lyase family protein [Nocardioides sp. B-3]
MSAHDALSALADELDQRLAAADAELVDNYPGDRGTRQPVHTVYVPGDKYDADTIATWGAGARDVLSQHGRSVMELAEALELRPSSAVEVYDRVRAKLEREPIEDLRIDFEDGYGNRPDDREDAAVIAAARAPASSVKAGNASPYHGIRIKSFEAPTRRRGLRTLGLFVGELADADAVTDGFVITLPKVTSVDQVEAMVTALETIERAHGIATGTLLFEIQIETPQSILGPDGSALVAKMIHAGGRRVTGLHYGTYDYSASLGVAAAYQSMEHPAADHAKDVMQVAAAGTGVFISDGSTNILPVGDRDAVPLGPAPARPVGTTLAVARHLLGLGPAPGPAAEPVRGDVRLLPRGPAHGRGPPPRLRARRRLWLSRRAGDRCRARRVRAPRS